MSAVRLQAIKSELGCGNAIARLNFHENSVTASLPKGQIPFEGGRAHSVTDVGMNRGPLVQPEISKGISANGAAL